MNRALTAMVACGIAIGTYEGGASIADASTSSHITTISFVEHETSDQSFHLGPKAGVAVGYVELAANEDIQGNKKIGHDGGNCVITRLSGGTADDLCNVVFVLAGGQVDANGLVTSTPSGPGTFTMAIVGGTGLYSGARGEVTTVPAQSPKITLHITD